MTYPTENPHALTAWADVLVCPVCHGILQQEPDRIACLGCGRAYPFEDGIPVLIAERNLNAPSR